MSFKYLMKDEVTALFLKKDDLKESAVHLENAEAAQSAAQMNDDSVRLCEQRQQTTWKSKNEAESSADEESKNICMQMNSESDDFDNDGFISTQGANADYWESD